MAKTVTDGLVVTNSADCLRRNNAAETTAVIPYVSPGNWLKSVLERHRRSYEDDESEEEEITDYKFEDDLVYLRSLDPKEWKDQDHYQVLGIKNLRHRASEELIKKAHKFKILKHHPDKRKAMGEEIRDDDDYFTCITRAWETLGNPIKRRSYDSIDPEFNNDLPDEKDAKKNFFIVMGKAFKENARWSVKKPVPQLGHMETSKDKVEKFYSFWYRFESWREYSYLDEEDKESGQDREMRRYIEKQNKAIRAKRKKEEMSRIRSLVDMAYNLDPRIRKFQQQEKDKKLAIKRAKADALRAKQLEEERMAHEKAEIERVEREKREAEQKAEQLMLKQLQDKRKKALRKERKALRDLCKANNYYSQDLDESIRHMEALEKVCEMFDILRLEEATKKVQAEGKEGFLKIIAETEEELKAERRAASVYGFSDGRNAKQVKPQAISWSESDVQLLIKAVNLFPAGTNQRWQVVANFVNQHSSNQQQTNWDAKQVLAKAKDLQSMDFSKSTLKEQANKNAFDNFNAEKKGKEESVEERMPPSSGTTERLDNPTTNGNCGEGEEKKEAAAAAAPSQWTPTEQKLLEQALKTYPNSTTDRWDRIAECIPARTKKDCIKRYKELVELIKAKKAAQPSK